MEDFHKAGHRQCVTATQGPDRPTEANQNGTCPGLGRLETFRGSVSTQRREPVLEPLSPSPGSPNTTLLWSLTAEALTQIAVAVTHHTYRGLKTMPTHSSFLSTKLPARHFRASFPPCLCNSHHLDKIRCLPTSCPQSSRLAQQPWGRKGAI